MADVVEESEDRPDHFDPQRRWRVRVKRDKGWADGYGPTARAAQKDATAKLDASPGLVGKYY